MGHPPLGWTTGRIKWSGVLRLLAWGLLLSIGMCGLRERRETPVTADPITATGEAFDRALPLILRFEGGYVNHPADTGQATNKGITQATYDAYRKSLGLASRDVRRITDAEVADIYEERYWDALQCDQYPWPACLVLFDAAVNHGVARAKRFLREVGPDPVALLARRERFYHAIVAQRPEAKVFLRGWLRRLAHLKQEVVAHAD